MAVLETRTRSTGTILEISSTSDSNSICDSSLLMDSSWIESATIIGRETYEKKIFYIIAVREEGNGEVWKVKRSYSDFRRIRNATKSHCKLRIEFPRKLIRTTPSGICSRQRQLSSFLNTLVSASTECNRIQKLVSSFVRCSSATDPYSGKIPSQSNRGSVLELTEEEAQKRGSLGVMQHQRYHSLLNMFICLTENFKEVHKQQYPSSMWLCTLVNDRITGIEDLPTSYVISVSPLVGAPWTVQRRYGDFSSFHEAIRAILPSSAFAPFPPRHVFKPSPQALDNRQHMLHKYLSSVVEHAQMSQALRQIVTTFLYAPRRKSHIRA